MQLSNSTFKESIDRKMVLAEDPLDIVELMIEYFYTSDDEADSTTIGGTLMKSLTRKAAAGPPRVHAGVFTIADKHDIPDLKSIL